MFTGIVECMGELEDARPEGSNRVFTIRSPISQELEPDQSVSHDGVCLTIVHAAAGVHEVVAVVETLDRSILGNIQPGAKINLERAMQLGERLDGHLVQGHVDAKLQCQALEDRSGSMKIVCNYPEDCAHLLIPKGSVCLNGVSLTIAELNENSFSVSVIPYTWEHTNLRFLRPGNFVNVEFDMVGKYLHRFYGMRSA